MANLNLSHTTTGLIGGLGMTRVTVYNQRAAPDGKQSGCPHIHAISSEAYYVLEGTGQVELHDLEKGGYNIDLRVGTYLQFPANVMHRLVNHQGLVILGIMSNAGLAENGDARIYFGREIDEDPSAYAAATGLVANGLEGALDRRDLAVKGYTELLQLWDNDRDAYFAELKRFIDAHQEHVRSNPDKFAPYIAHGPRAWAERTEQMLDGEINAPAGEEILRNLPGDEPLLGMCGTLHPIMSDHP